MPHVAVICTCRLPLLQASSDMVISNLPEPSMGSAVEVWEVSIRVDDLISSWWLDERLHPMVSW
eukprot:572041-Amphidinium_carterae.2